MTICHLCLNEAHLCRSHIIPEFLYSSLYDKDHRFIELSEIAEGGKLTKPQKGHREKLLCERCESRINQFEKHARRLFVDPLPPCMEGSQRFRAHPRLDYTLSKLFFLSILWRASVSSLDMFRHVRLGRHEDIIRRMILSRDPRDTETYSVVLFALKFDGDHFRDFMVEPTYMRVEGRRCYRFVMAGFVVLIFVASLPPPQPYPRLALSPTSPIKSFDSELQEFKFLRVGWDAAAAVKIDGDP
ncbi:hypothetical protein OPIT5_06415 [Opitutaceae bacterium TAV5]|nr:hypothetical protein OPIT5_06415 [Opitutaceae bacterium TAV5]